MPIAVILLPGGFVLLAFTWVYKVVLVSGKRPVEKPVDTIGSPREEGAFFSILHANNLHPRSGISGACIRPGAMRRHPAAADADGEPSNQKVAA